MGEGYKMGCAEQLTNYNKPTFNREPVDIIEKVQKEGRSSIDNELKIRLKDNQEKIVDI